MSLCQHLKVYINNIVHHTIVSVEWIQEFLPLKKNVFGFRCAFKYSVFNFHKQVKGHQNSLNILQNNSLMHS